jgi:carbonic anhydrase
MRKPIPDLLFKRNQQWQRQYQQLPQNTRDQLVEAQSPKALWLGCVDSRVNPSQILNAEPGELLVHRNMGNICCDEGALGTLEFGVSQLGIRTIIICGHYNCGAVQASMNLPKQALHNSPADAWVRKHFDPVANASWESSCQSHTLKQYRNLIKNPVFDRLNKSFGPLEVYAFIYDIQNGQLEPIAQEQIRASSVPSVPNTNDQPAQFHGLTA